ncbi:MAG: redoxin family protein [Gammaproteobacteria bacterium]|nr:redoxin family protein [Gammaproteobacteria bacterium]MCI0591530.1 redoxin family protein [Gammaproteobacteria bacterium]
MKRIAPSTLFATLLTGVLVGIQISLSAFADVSKTPSLAPEFSHASAEEWINSEPLTLSALRGQVVLLDFWTFDCWNCYRSIPWINSLEQRYAPRGLQVIGVHTPEFPHEKVRSNIVKKVNEFEIHHPVMIDNDYSYWRAMGNRYWPAFFLIDKQGRVRAAFFGETHEGDRNATQMEEAIEKLLGEPA